MHSNTFVLTNSQVALTVDGKSYTFGRENGKFEWAKSLLMNCDNDDNGGEHVVCDKVLKGLNPMCNLPKNLPFKVENDVVTYRNKLVPHQLGKKLLACAQDGQYKPFLEFWRKLEQNVSFNSKNQLYTFVEKHAVPIFADGYLLMWKKVQDNYLDFHSGTISYKPGKVVKMNRNEISDDARSACSSGLHVGSLPFVKEFHTGGRIVEVRVHPKNVVSVPHDADAQKVRVCSMKVLRDVTEPVAEGWYEGQLQNVVDMKNYEW